MGKEYVGERLGGYLGERCLTSNPNASTLGGGFFSKGYSLQNGANSDSKGIPDNSFTTGSTNGWIKGSTQPLADKCKATKLAPKLVTSFFATTNVGPGMKGPGPLVSWSQKSRRLAVAGGEHRSIRLWDMRTELHCGDLLHSPSTSSNSNSFGACITALHSMGEHYVVAGYSDGKVFLLDVRQGLYMPSMVAHSTSNPPVRLRERSIVSDWATDSWVVYALLKEDFKIITGAFGGEINMLDLRTTGNRLLHKATSEISAMTANDDLFAIGTVDQTLSVHSSVNGSLVNNIQYGASESFLSSQRSQTPISGLAFHPTRPILAASNSSIVSVYGLSSAAR